MNHNNFHNDNNLNNLNKRDTLMINNNDNNYNSQDRHMFPASTREHSQTIWIRCRFVRRQRKGAKPVRTKLNLA